MNLVESKTLLDSVDARTRLAGSNKMEILLFSLGTREIFGINVFKVREVGRTPHITKTPNMPRGVEGLISLRGNVIPVLSLAPFLQLDTQPGRGKTMMVAEYSKRTLGFLVHDVDRIIRVDWERVKAPESVLSANQGLITAVIELEGGGLVSILDVEQILANAFGEAMIIDIPPARVDPDTSVFFVDDSVVARRKISEVFDKLGVRHKHATNGLEAWTRLQGLAAHASQMGRNIRDDVRDSGRRRDARDGWLRADQEYQGRSAFRRSAGRHALVAFVGGESRDGQICGGRCIRGQVRCRSIGRYIAPPD